MQKGLFIILFVIMATLCGFGQQKFVWNKANYDEYPFHFGFALGLNNLDFKVVHSPLIQGELDTVLAVNNYRQPGFNIHMVGNLRVNKVMDLRFIPGLIFGQRDLKYYRQEIVGTDTTFNTHLMKIESTFLSFPLYMKFRAKRLNNWRPYVLIGGNYCFDLESEKKIKEEEKPKIRLNRNDFYIEFGAGIDYYFPFFKLATELRFSLGFMDMVRKDNSEYTMAFDKLNSKMVSLVIFVE